MAGNQNEARPARSVRLLKVGESVRHALSDIFLRGMVQDPDLAGVSVTVSEVRVSRDLRNATVFIQTLGTEDQVAVAKALNTHTKFIRGELSGRVRMKFMPRLVFRVDESFNQADTIARLLDQPRVKRDLAKPGEA